MRRSRVIAMRQLQERFAVWVGLDPGDARRGWRLAEARRTRPGDRSYRSRSGRGSVPAGGRGLVEGVGQEQAGVPELVPAVSGGQRGRIGAVDQVWTCQGLEQQQM